MFFQQIYQLTRRASYFIRVCLIFALCAGLLAVSPNLTAVRAQTQYCTGPDEHVATPLIDLGSNEYIRMDGTPTGQIGGLYPGGSNQRPPQNEAAGLAVAQQVVPLDTAGNPDPANGRIVMISVGMSNASLEFGRFTDNANHDSRINSKLVILNTALSNATAPYWSDPDGIPWTEVQHRLDQANLSDQQVQVAWVKEVLVGNGDFPAKAEELQGQLEQIARNLKAKFPNIKLAYYSSRTRSYTYWRGLSPEPVAYETGFAVRWMIEKQINGDPTLNYDPAHGPVVAPFLTWGPYLWADGGRPRSDGLTWQAVDMVQDCTHPSSSGIDKVASMLMDFFTSDNTATPWFLANPNPPPSPTPPSPTPPSPTPPPPNGTQTLLPLIFGGTPTSGSTLTPLTPAETQPISPTFTQPFFSDSIPAGPSGTSRAVLIGAAISGMVIIGVLLGIILVRRR
jgi:hypothetical protein